MMDYQGLLELVRSRRSIRRFKPDPVPDELIEKLLEAARWAPSGANGQPWEFLVIRDPETKARINEFYSDQHSLSRRMELTREERLRHPIAHHAERDRDFREMPVLVIVVGDPRCKDTYLLGADGQRNFVSDLANAFLYMHLAARSLGLGSCWNSSAHHPYMQTMLQDLLGIPRGYVIYDMMGLGYPVREPRPRTVRELATLVHYERYDGAKQRSDEQVKEFIATLHRERVAPREPAGVP